MSIGRQAIGRAAIGRQAAAGGAQAAVLGMSLQGWVSAAPASLGMRLAGIASIPAASLPLVLESPDPVHYAGQAARWSLSVVIDGVDVSASLVGQASIDTSENASGVATVQLMPSAGAVDPDAYERKPITITFIGQDAAGQTLYTARRFSGITTAASYDADDDRVTVRATTDLQGKLENMSRESIASLVGGLWSEHVFDDTADGYQYALDRLATVPTELHVNTYGQLTATAWAAKATADFEHTDAQRFRGSTSRRRVSRRDLLSRVDITLDFRFVRLRHRELTVSFVDTIGWCAYLAGQGQFCQRDVIERAAASNDWTLIGSINYTDLPAPGTYCLPSRVWVGDYQKRFCLGANWKAARRWAQTITEVYSLSVQAPDIEESIGRQAIGEDYGISSMYDASAFEADKNFSSAMIGSSYNGALADYILDATDAERTGRQAMSDAQECVLAKAKTEILSRARGNEISYECLYDPTVTIEATGRLNTPAIVAKGKVRGLVETFDFERGWPTMRVTLALSRHGGSGLAVDTPLTPPAAPGAPIEAPTGRTYAVQARAGGMTGVIPDSDTFEGWITNAYGAAQTDPTKLYQERFVLRMPAVEATARDATDVQQSATYTVAVPEDELTEAF